MSQHEASNIRRPSTSPHFFMQNGDASTLTPMILFTRFAMYGVLLIMLKTNKTSVKIINSIIIFKN